MLSQTAVARFRPTTIYNQLEEVRVAANTDGCRSDGSFDGWTGGKYNASAGPWSGASDELTPNAGTASGLVNSGAHTFIGSYTDAATGDIGGVFSSYNSITGNNIFTI